LIREKNYIIQLEKIYTFLNKLTPITQEEFNQITQLCTIRKFDKKVCITGIGETENYINTVLEGMVRKYIMSGKKEVTKQLAMEGHIIYSEISFISRIPSPVIIEAIEPATLLSIKYDDLQQLFKDMPQLERLARLLLSDLFIRKDNRDFLYLSKTTRERFLDYVQSHPHILQRVPQKYIASYLDIKPETFSRLKHLLQKKRS
jgi:CRP-like cAMP-binding protein